MDAHVVSTKSRNCNTGVAISAVTPLRAAGFAVQWLKPRSKAPATGDGWPTRPVATLDDLRRTHRPGNNVGVRLGRPSLLVCGLYLHALDIDIRVASSASEAWREVDRLFPGVNLREFPSVVSGSGGESRHIYLIAAQPFKGKKLARSAGFQMVFDPQKGRDVKKHNWEIELFGTGKQLAMPPSIHPDSGQPYRWERPFDLDALAFGDGPVVSIAALEAAGALSEQDLDSAESPRTERLGLSVDEGREILSYLPLDEWCEDRDGWTKAGMALKHEYGDDGYDLWCEFSQQSEKFDPKTQRTAWKSFKGRTSTPVRMATLKAAAAAARLAARFDDLPEETADEFSELLGRPIAAPPAEDEFSALLTGAAGGDDLASFDLTPAEKAESPALSWTSLLDFNEEGGIRPTLHNLELIVKNDPRLTGLAQLNEFTQETVQRTPPGTRASRRGAAKEMRQLGGRVWEVRDQVNGDLWSDDRDFAVRSILEAPRTQGGYGLKVSDRDLKAAIVLAANENAFHPVREYLESVVWDGVPRADTFLIRHLGADDTAYTRSVARLTLLGAVTRIFEPGAKFDFVTILEGLQGKRKSTFIAILARRWFAELEGNFSDRKSLVEKMQGSWILEIPELSGFTRGEVQEIKAFVSSTTDKVRLAYARRAGEFPRQSIFIGSTNEEAYLKDDTGGRRFWPISCRVAQIDTAAFEGEVDQLWAEAVTLYRRMRAEQPRGTLPLYLSDAEARSEAERLQESRRLETAQDAMAGEFAAWLDRPVQSGSLDHDGGDAPPRRDTTCLMELWVDCLGKERGAYNNGVAQTLGRAMKLVPGWGTSGARFDHGRYGRQRIYVRR